METKFSGVFVGFSVCLFFPNSYVSLFDYLFTSKIVCFPAIKIVCFGFARILNEPSVYDIVKHLCGLYICIVFFIPPWSSSS